MQEEGRRTAEKFDVMNTSAVMGRVYEAADARRTAAAEPAEVYAWWSLTYETPNPEKLPVKVRFQWLKGLE